jgi:hypothetical protein
VISVEWARPVYEMQGVTSSSSVLFLGSKIPAGRDVAFVLELPLSHFGVSGGPPSAGISQTIVANTYVGAELRASEPLAVEFGLWLPTAPGERSARGAIRNALLVDVNRAPVGLQGVWVAQAALEVEVESDAGAFLRARLAPWGGFASTVERDPELLTNYHLFLGYQGDHFRLAGGVAGLALVTTDEPDLGKRTTHQLQLVGEVGSGRVRPKAYARFWLDDGMLVSYQGTAETALSLGVDVRL